jgi:hypothetical protein
LFPEGRGQILRFGVVRRRGLGRREVVFGHSYKISAISIRYWSGSRRS